MMGMKVTVTIGNIFEGHYVMVPIISSIDENYTMPKFIIASIPIYCLEARIPLKKTSIFIQVKVGRADSKSSH